MSGAAQREDIGELSYGATGTDGAATGAAISGAAALKQLAVERLAAHRSRKAEVQAREDEMKAALLARRLESRRGASKVKDAVAARYQSSVSYREFLAIEADRALQQARAEAEVAARNAQAVAEAKFKLMQELEQWNREDPAPRPAQDGPSMLSLVENAAPSLAAAATSATGYKVRLMEEFGPAPAIMEALPAVRALYPETASHSEDLASELKQLEEEIAFRLSPEFLNHSLETTTIPANIIEFPRQLVAPKKARPRLAEGPLREESKPEPQLRIFEVEPEQISPEVVVETTAPEWQSLQLDASLDHRTLQHHAPLDAQLQFTMAPQTAPLEQRLMAAAVDACCVGAASMSFAAAAFYIAGKSMATVPLPLLGASAAGVIAAIFLTYQLLFFTLSEATPGMRYARIGLCTFADDNPTRKAMRRRILAKLIAACPLGLGIAWAMLDSERLGWHDRMSRMYPRAY